MKKLTTEEFIQKAIEVHGDKYVYDKTIYIKANADVEVWCKFHKKIFLIKARNHIDLKRKGECQDCSLINRALKRRSNTSDFIKKAMKIHGDKFVYDKVNYINVLDEVEIKCSIHGYFLQKPHDHLRGAGCQECGGSKPLTLDLFIQRANDVFNNFYNYKNSIYVNARTSLEVICPKHGSFYPTPDNHINKQKGCPKCSKRVSQSEIDWIDSIEKERGIKIIRQYRIPKTRYFADGYCSQTNEIFEMNGDYYHGNPDLYGLEKYNFKCKKTFKELYDKTLKKEAVIIKLGYTLVSIWESDYKKIRN